MQQRASTGLRAKERTELLFGCCPDACAKLSFGPLGFAGESPESENREPPPEEAGAGEPPFRLKRLLMHWYKWVVGFAG